MYLFNYHICMYLNIYLCLFIMPKWSELYIYFIPFPTVLHCDVLEWCSTSHAFSMVFHSSWVNVDMAKFTKARVVMMASCRSFRSICASVPLLCRQGASMELVHYVFHPPLPKQSNWVYGWNNAGVSINTSELPGWSPLWVRFLMFHQWNLAYLLDPSELLPGMDCFDGIYSSHLSSIKLMDGSDPSDTLEIDSRYSLVSWKWNIIDTLTINI